MVAFLDRHLCRLDLRFPDREDEEAFRLSCERDVIRVAVCSCTAVSTFFVVRALTLYVHAFSHDQGTYGPASQDPRSLEIALCALLIIFNFLMACRGVCRLCFPGDQPGKSDSEIYALVTFIIDSAAILFVRTDIILLIYGGENDPRYHYHPNFILDTEDALLTVCLLLSMLCSSCQVRLHRLRLLLLVVVAEVFVAEHLAGILGRDHMVETILVLSALAQTWMVWNAEGSRREAWRHFTALQAQEAESERQASIASELLANFCDCVLRLDSEMRLRTDCPKLAAMLLRSPRQLEAGACLTRLMSKEDLGRLEGHVRLRERDGCAPGSLTVEMFDSMGKAVKVRTYFASVCKAGVQETMVGVVEEVPWSQTHMTELVHRSASESPSDMDYEGRCDSHKDSSRSTPKVGAEKFEACTPVTFSCVGSEERRSPASHEPMVVGIHSPTGGARFFPESETAADEVEVAESKEAGHVEVGATDGGALASTPTSFASRIDEGEAFLSWLAEKEPSLTASEPPTMALHYGIVNFTGESPERSDYLRTAWLAIVTPESEAFRLIDAEVTERIELRCGFDAIVCLTRPTTQQMRKATMKRTMSKLRADRRYSETTAPVSSGRSSQARSVEHLRHLSVVPPGCLVDATAEI